MVLTFRSVIVCCILLFSVYCNSQINHSDKNNNQLISNSINIEEKWELPSILKEISGIAYIDADRFACVQDEDGKIFVYNTATSKIEKIVEFAVAGDYEGIALVGKNAYISRSDGMIFEIMDWKSENRQIVEYRTGLTSRSNVEGLCYDPKNNRLLIAIKGKLAKNRDYKGIFSFDLISKQMMEEAVYKIDLKDPIFHKLNEKDQENYIMPSEIDIHPITGDIYITEGKEQKLLILDRNGKIKALYRLNENDFSQAEGMAFSSSGELYISNEGRKEAGNILRISFYPL